MSDKKSEHPRRRPLQSMGSTAGFEMVPEVGSPRLMVVRGDGAGSSPRHPPLTVLEPPVSRTPYQLSLPLVPPQATATVISVGLDDVSVEGLEHILRTYTPRLAIDVRLSPSFSSWGLTRRAFNALLEAWRIEYQYWESLCNRFVGDFLDYRLTLDRYATYLKDRAELHHLYELVHSSGPVLLLGRMPEHALSERGVLADALAMLGPIEIAAAAPGARPRTASSGNT